ncbi:hypothetical protein CYMTET_50058 [Cymbomonas tetramitiformis]|uniref:Uncharacterized protein n=1 Tax=Cymbomonas tetramitiformis TaxID=36881 RepID=A0AAE0BNZ3_9CHLO|nr:hypothetical protein CYMTET_50058 [Cymbomonas tetramitiformis]
MSFRGDDIPRSTRFVRNCIDGSMVGAGWGLLMGSHVFIKEGLKGGELHRLVGTYAGKCSLAFAVVSVAIGELHSLLLSQGLVQR